MLNPSISKNAPENCEFIFVYAFVDSTILLLVHMTPRPKCIISGSMNDMYVIKGGMTKEQMFRLRLINGLVAEADYLIWPKGVYVSEECFFSIYDDVERGMLGPKAIHKHLIEILKKEGIDQIDLSEHSFYYMVLIFPIDRVEIGRPPLDKTEFGDMAIQFFAKGILCFYILPFENMDSIMKLVGEEMFLDSPSERDNAFSNSSEEA